MKGLDIRFYKKNPYKTVNDIAELLTRYSPMGCRNLWISKDFYTCLKDDDFRKAFTDCLKVTIENKLEEETGDGFDFAVGMRPKKDDFFGGYSVTIVYADGNADHNSYCEALKWYKDGYKED